MVLSCIACLAVEGLGGGWGGWRCGGQIIRPVLRDEGWLTCKQVTSVLDDNS